VVSGLTMLIGALAAGFLGDAIGLKTELVLEKT
jgi:hypothetical protein